MNCCFSIISNIQLLQFKPVTVYYFAFLHNFNFHSIAIWFKLIYYLISCGIFLRFIFENISVFPLNVEWFFSFTSVRFVRTTLRIRQLLLSYRNWCKRFHLSDEKQTILIVLFCVWAVMSKYSVSDSLLERSKSKIS